MLRFIPEPKGHRIMKKTYASFYSENNFNFFIKNH